MVFITVIVILFFHGQCMNGKRQRERRVCVFPCACESVCALSDGARRRVDRFHTNMSSGCLAILKILIVLLGLGPPENPLESFLKVSTGTIQ